MRDLPELALEFARKAHEGQVRKYTGEPYINHPIEVARIVSTVPHTDEMLAAAYLHDVVEDCGFSFPEIFHRFGEVVGKYVYWLTDVSMHSDGNRAQRKAIDRAHLALAPAAAQTIKLADLIDNTRTIADRDPKFWEVYRLEKIALLDVLTKGDMALMVKAREQVGATYAV